MKKLGLNFLILITIFQNPSAASRSMYIQQTSTQSIAVIFGAFLILCIICAFAYCVNAKKRRRQVNMTPQRLPKAWYAVRQELIVPQNQQPQEFV